MNVYLVSSYCDTDGEDLIGVYGSLRKAHNAAQSYYSDIEWHGKYTFFLSFQDLRHEIKNRGYMVHHPIFGSDGNNIIITKTILQ